MIVSHHPCWSEVFGDTAVSKSSIKQPLTYTPVSNPNMLIDYPSQKLALSEVSRHLPTDSHEKFHTTSHPGMLFHSLCWKTGEEREGNNKFQLHIRLLGTCGRFMQSRGNYSLLTWHIHKTQRVQSPPRTIQEAGKREQHPVLSNRKINGAYLDCKGDGYITPWIQRQSKIKAVSGKDLLSVSWMTSSLCLLV